MAQEISWSDDEDEAAIATGQDTRPENNEYGMTNVTRNDIQPNDAGGDEYYDMDAADWEDEELAALIPVCGITSAAPFCDLKCRRFLTFTHFFFFFFVCSRTTM